MFGSASKSNFLPVVLASIALPMGLLAALSARASGTLTISVYPSNDIVEALKNSLRPNVCAKF